MNNMKDIKIPRDQLILYEMFRRAFAVSTPPGDFDSLLETSPRDEEGRILIPFKEYECDETTMSDIVQSVLKEWKVPKWRRRAFEVNFWLGCSPKTKKTV